MHRPPAIAKQHRHLRTHESAQQGEQLDPPVLTAIGRIFEMMGGGKTERQRLTSASAA